MEESPTKWKSPKLLQQNLTVLGILEEESYFLKNIACFTEFSSSSGFAICPENTSPFISPDALHYLQKSRKKSILQMMLSEDGKLAGKTLPTHTKLPQAFC